MRTLLTLALALIFGCQTSPEVKKPASLLLSLSRGACFGACPVYGVEVMSDGLVRFKGERHVKVTEPVEVTLDAATLGQLTARLEQSAFSSWTDYVKPDTTDLPTVTLSFKGKTLRHDRGDAKAPAALTKLEDDVDALLGTERWVKGAGAELQ